MAVDQRARVVYQIEVDASRAVRQLGSINRNTDRLANTFDRVESRATRLGRTLRNAFVGGFITATVSRLGRAFVQLADRAQDLNARLSGATGGGAAEALNNIFDIAQRLGVPLEALGNSFVRLSNALPGASVDQVSSSLETISTALATTGASAAETNSVLLQLSQGLGAGALRGDEFNSIVEGAPVLLRAWAEALGRGDESLKSLRDSNAFTAESFIRLNDEIQQNIQNITGLSRPAETVSRALTRVGNAFLFAFTEQAGRGVDGLEPLVRLLNGLADAVIPTLEAAMASLEPIVEAVFNQFERGEQSIETLSGAFNSLSSAVSGSTDDSAQFVDAWENVFFRLIPNGIDAVLTFGRVVRDTFFNIADSILQVGLLFPSSIADLVTGGPGLSLRFDALRAQLDATFAEPFREATALVERFENRARRVSLRGLSRAQGEVDVGTDPVRDRGRIRPPPGDDAAARRRNAAAQREAARAARERARQEAIALRNLQDYEDTLERINRSTRSFRADLEERVRLQEDELRIAQLQGAEKQQLIDLLDIERERRSLIRDLAEATSAADREIATQNLAAFNELTPRLIANQEALREIERSGEQAGGAFFDGIETAGEGLKDVFRDVFKNGLDEAQSFADSLRDILANTVNRILDSLIDTFVDQLTTGITQGIQGVGSGSSPGGGGILGALFGGGGGGGFSLNNLFGGGGGGGLAAAGGPADAFNLGGGGGGFNLSSLASPLGFLAGGLLSSVFDSKSSVRETSPLELDPLPDVLGPPNFTVVNNGPPLQVDGVSRSNGDYQLIVSAVRETRSVYERDLRRGYGGFSEALRGNTTADNSV